MTRVEDLAQSRDTNKDDRRASFPESSVEEVCYSNNDTSAKLTTA